MSNVYCDAPSRIAGNANIFRGNQLVAASATPILQLASGTNLTVADNLIYQGGAGTAFTVQSGVTLAHAYNTIIGTVTNGGTASTYSVPTF